jgi:hypothetical protein
MVPIDENVPARRQTPGTRTRLTGARLMDHSIENFSAVWILVNVEAVGISEIARSAITIKSESEEILARFATQELADDFIQQSKLDGARPRKLNRQQFLDLLHDFQDHLSGNNAKQPYNSVGKQIDGPVESIEELIAMVEKSGGN